jgi:hypothetical protein
MFERCITIYVGYSIGTGITPRQAIGTQLIPRLLCIGPKLSIQTDYLHEVHMLAKNSMKLTI